MTMRFPKKIRKRRGGRTHGFGRISQHRKSGQKGGKGFAGMKKHGKSWIIKNIPDYFGKHGFNRPIETKRILKTITLRDVNKLIESAQTTSKKKGLLKIDLASLGYDKLLGSGVIYKPAEIIVPTATEKAFSKVESIGGKIITETE
ncbi:MAG: uL15 family ribosomal protein [Candidatus Odinarchaeia archaeon]